MKKRRNKKRWRFGSVAVSVDVDAAAAMLAIGLIKVLSGTITRESEKQVTEDVECEIVNEKPKLLGPSR